MTQTSYSQNPAIGVAGQVRNGRLSDAITRIVEGATVAAGLGVIGGTAEHQAKSPVAAFTTKFLGVVRHDPTLAPADQSFAAGDQIGVVVKGVVLVAYEADTAPTADTPAYCRHTANGAGKLTLGAFRADADTANASVVPGGMWRRVFTADGLAELELVGTVN